MKEMNLSEYKSDVERLLNYLPWLESKCGANVSRIYDDNNLSTSTIAFPVYDSTLLSFVKEAMATDLMDSNYVYAYTGYNIRTVEDEKRAIEEATVKDAALLCGILSKYVLGGNTKGSVWTQAVFEGIFVLVLKRMKKLLEIWDAPLA